MLRSSLTYSSFVLLSIATGFTAVKSGTCTFELGQCCDPSSCNQKCQGAHSGATGSCDPASNACVCAYECKPPPPGCTSNRGVCSSNCDENCCAQKCVSKFGDSSFGTCEDSGSSLRLCLCHFYCPPKQ